VLPRTVLWPAAWASRYVACAVPLVRQPVVESAVTHSIATPINLRMAPPRHEAWSLTGNQASRSVDGIRQPIRTPAAPLTSTRNRTCPKSDRFARLPPVQAGLQARLLVIT